MLKKKPKLNLNDLFSYQLISLLPSFSKIIEHLVVSRLYNHIKLLNLDELFQSAFKSGHNTKIA